jgi:hypothetical protein
MDAPAIAEADTLPMPSRRHVTHEVAALSERGVDLAEEGVSLRRREDTQVAVDHDDGL